VAWRIKYVLTPPSSVNVTTSAAADLIFASFIICMTPWAMEFPATVDVSVASAHLIDVAARLGDVG
jgi:hypothetical protein